MMCPMKRFLTYAASMFVISGVTGCFGAHSNSPMADAGATDVRVVAVLDSQVVADDRVNLVADATRSDVRVADVIVADTPPLSSDATARCVFQTQLPDTCAEAVRLQVPDRIDCVAATPRAPEPRGCFGGSALYQYFVTTIPPRTGIEVRTSGDAPPIPGMASSCGVPSCEHYGPNGSFGEGPQTRSHYLGNGSDDPMTVTIGAWWPQGWRRAPYSIEVISTPLPGNASCLTPAAFPAGVASASPGAFVASCGGEMNGRFYTLAVPPKRAVRFSDPQPRWRSMRSFCICADGSEDPFFYDLKNVTDFTRPVTILLADDASVSFDELPDSAGCMSAPLLALNSSIRLDMNRAGHVVVACNEITVSNEGAHYVRVRVPAALSVRVSTTVPGAGPEQGTYLWASNTCDATRCTTSGTSVIGSGTAQITLTAPPNEEKIFVVGIGMVYLPGRDQVIELRASL